MEHNLGWICVQLSPGTALSRVTNREDAKLPHGIVPRPIPQNFALTVPVKVRIDEGETLPSPTQKVSSQAYGIRLSLLQPSGNLVLIPLELRPDAWRQESPLPFVHESRVRKSEAILNRFLPNSPGCCFRKSYHVDKSTGAHEQ
jgi:hypothetical protein